MQTSKSSETSLERDAITKNKSKGVQMSSEDGIKNGDNNPNTKASKNDTLDPVLLVRPLLQVYYLNIFL